MPLSKGAVVKGRSGELSAKALIVAARSCSNAGSLLEERELTVKMAVRPATPQRMTPHSTRVDCISSERPKSHVEFTSSTPSESTIVVLLGKAFEVLDHDARPRSNWPLFRPLHEHACCAYECLQLFLSRSLFSHPRPRPHPHANADADAHVQQPRRRRCCPLSTTSPCPSPCPRACTPRRPKHEFVSGRSLCPRAGLPRCHHRPPA